MLSDPFQFEGHTMSFITDTLSNATGLNVTQATDYASGVAANQKPTANQALPNMAMKNSPYLIPLIIGAVILVIFMMKKRG